ncbi:MAG TPA: 2-oxo acid dehydrogenase subunit E2 [Nocardioidaceae bacterium]|nr:2-oxo acid dehydrogenase subunit E2 [Nocardioidaceae bacterium]
MIVAAEPRRPNTRHRASPRARRLLREAELHEPDVAGSGPDGRILAADVESVVAAAAQSASVPDRRVEASDPDRSPAGVGAAFMAVEVDYFAIDRVRRSATGALLGHMAFVARAVVDALAAYPRLNAQVGEQTVHVTQPVHLGLAVDLAPDGQVTPVVHDADRLRLGALAQQISAMTERARAGSLDPEDTDGATFTLSDSGSHGTMLIAPALGSDQMAAFAVSSAQAKPVAVEREPGDYVVAVHPVGTLGISFDHHAIDTGYAAGFLDLVREALETRDWSTEL